MLRRCALFLILAGGLSANDFAAEHRRAAAENPQGLSFVLSLADSRPFRIGEAIPVRLSFSSDGLNDYAVNASTWDRAGRLHLDRFLVSPNTHAVDPVADYYLSGVTPVRGGGALVRADLDEEPETLEFALNQWLRFDRPDATACTLSRPGSSGAERLLPTWWRSRSCRATRTGSGLCSSAPSVRSPLVREASRVCRVSRRCSLRNGKRN